jgi:hypothetical protein
MERLRSRLFVIAALLCLVGAAVYALPKKRDVKHNEAWMEARVPDTVGRYAYVPSRENPKQSFRMDPETYDTLHPFGIVCRSYSLDPSDSSLPPEFEVVVIASSSRSSFHDPSVCFTGHGLDITGGEDPGFDTHWRQDLQATFIDTANKESHKRYMAAYLYKGPDGFTATTLGVKWMLLLHRLRHPFDPGGIGVFYRFMREDTSATEDEHEKLVKRFKKFIGDYMDAAYESSADPNHSADDHCF